VPIWLPAGPPTHLAHTHTPVPHASRPRAHAYVRARARTRAHTHTHTHTRQGVDFEGGTFCFQSGAQPLRVAPAAGSLLVFSADASNTHRVEPVTRGHRVTLTLWFTLDDAHQEDAKVGGRALCMEVAVERQRALCGPPALCFAARVGLRRRCCRSCMPGARACLTACGSCLGATRTCGWRTCSSCCTSLCGRVCASKPRQQRSTQRCRRHTRTHTNTRSSCRRAAASCCRAARQSVRPRRRRTPAAAPRTSAACRRRCWRHTCWRGGRAAAQTALPAVGAVMLITPQIQACVCHAAAAGGQAAAAAIPCAGS
jgi:hypothetical protein